MEKQRRDFLRTISSAVALPALAPILNPVGKSRAAETSRGDSQDIRAQFPLLGESVNGQPLTYLDSAATTQRPKAVLDALMSFYLHDNANPAKVLHKLARRCAEFYEEARALVARFLNAPGPEEVVFTRGTTEAINLVASSWGSANLKFSSPFRITTRTLFPGSWRHGAPTPRCGSWTLGTTVACGSISWARSYPKGPRW